MFNDVLSGLSNESGIMGETQYTLQHSQRIKVGAQEWSLVLDRDHSAPHQLFVSSSACSPPSDHSPGPRIPSAGAYMRSGARRSLTRSNRGSKARSTRGARPPSRRGSWGRWETMRESWEEGEYAGMRYNIQAMHT